MPKMLPPEWAKQQFIQLTWPHSGTDWADMLDEVNACFARISSAVTRFQDLLIVCANAEELKPRLQDADMNRICFAEIPSDDTWARDHGGITVFEEDKRVIYDFCFNGWGEKFDADNDNLITLALFQRSFFDDNITYRNCNDFVLEGGSIESDGAGTLLTTSACLLSENRNKLSRTEIESRLKDYFGLQRVLWLEHGYLAGDDTDSHVDTLARFCDEHTIAYVKCEDPQDEHYNELKLMEEELHQFRTMDGKPYKLIDLPMAEPVFDGNDRLPATYANFLIINGAVLVPTYQSALDEIAIKKLKVAFPDREVIGVDCLPLIKQHGSLHCVTMQYPDK
jgi:agmatine/peptidylarginine deiminase